MPFSQVLKIIGLCRKIDEIAGSLYEKLSVLSNDPELSRFWLQMSEEEKGHAEFWEQAEQLTEIDGLPDLFQSTRAMIHELEHSLKSSEELLRYCEESYSAGKAFTLAYRMEFYAMHPVFIMLFHIIGPIIGNTVPETEYENHIAHLIDMLRKRDMITPELELLHETLHWRWEENRKLVISLLRDKLTGLPNRRGFLSTARHLAFLAQRNSRTVGIIIAGLDNYNEISDRLGHTYGDQILKQVAKKFHQSFRASDLVGRYGDGEFIVFLPDVVNGNTPKIAEKFRDLVKTHSTAGIPVTVSTGYAEGKLEKNVDEALREMIEAASKGAKK